MRVRARATPTPTALRRMSPNFDPNSDSDSDPPPNPPPSNTYTPTELRRMNEILVNGMGRMNSHVLQVMGGGGGSGVSVPLTRGNRARTSSEPVPNGHCTSTGPPRASGSTSSRGGDVQQGFKYSQLAVSRHPTPTAHRPPPTAHRPLSTAPPPHQSHRPPSTTHHPPHTTHHTPPHQSHHPPPTTHHTPPHQSHHEDREPMDMYDPPIPDKSLDGSAHLK